MGVRSRRRVKSAWKGAVAGLAGGLAGSWVMNQFQAGLARLSERKGSGRDQAASQKGDDATVKVASAISETVLDHHLSDREKRVAGPAVHYSFGAAVGTVYGVLAEVAPVTTKGWGLPFGSAVWLGADEIGVPAAGLSQSPQHVPIATHASALATHLVYGATADAIRRAVRFALRDGGRS